MNANLHRSGTYVRQPTGYRAFIPAQLPPQPEVEMAGLWPLLSEADRALSRLDGAASNLPNPDLFVAMYVRHEAVLSSQIEGTQSTLEDVLAFEAEGTIDQRPKDVEEVVNYVAAMNHGLARLKDGFPLSLRLVREIHAKLMQGVRGENRDPGEFRRSQNWIGAANCGLADAEFIPPPPHEMGQALDNLERFLHERGRRPELLLCGMAHAQFETIHPFLDGNGRVGRLLITLFLCERGILERPLLYLSYFFKRRRAQYYDRLMAVRSDGDWEGWLTFFLQGIVEVSDAATQTVRAILALQREHNEALRAQKAKANAFRFLDFLFHTPVVSIGLAQTHLELNYMAARGLVKDFCDLGILRASTKRKRNRLYEYDAYIHLFDMQRIGRPEATNAAPDEATNSEPDAGPDEGPNEGNDATTNS